MNYAASFWAWERNVFSCWEILFFPHVLDSMIWEGDVAFWVFELSSCFCYLVFTSPKKLRNEKLCLFFLFTEMNEIKVSDSVDAHYLNFLQVNNFFHGITVYVQLENFYV